MSQIAIDQSIRELRTVMDNDFVLQYIVPGMMERITESSIVLPDYKQRLDQFLQKSRIEKYYDDFKPIDMTKLKTASVQNLLMIAVVYCLSNMTTYDFHLINLAFSLGLNESDVIVLLLLNNIYDIEAFCQKYKISKEACYNISTLKKLSALHKVIHNF